MKGNKMEGWVWLTCDFCWNPLPGNYILLEQVEYSSSAHAQVQNRVLCVKASFSSSVPLLHHTICTLAKAGEAPAEDKQDEAVEQLQEEEEAKEEAQLP